MYRIRISRPDKPTVLLENYGRTPRLAARGACRRKDIDGPAIVEVDTRYGSYRFQLTRGNQVRSLAHYSTRIEAD